MTGKDRRYKSLIVGASGFIGSSLTKKLLNAGHQVTGITGGHGLGYLKDFKDERFKVYPRHHAENNYKKMGKFNFVFNLSGYVDVKESFIYPLKYALNKPITTIKLIENCHTEKFINISTANIYDFVNCPLDEKSPLNPNSPYAVSQLSADYYTQILCGVSKIPYLILRIFNPYGPPNIKRGLIATIIKRLLAEEDVVLYNPWRKFDFTYIDDIADAIAFCAAKLKGAVNLGSAKPISLIELYKKISFLLFNDYKRPRIERSTQHKEEFFSNSNKLKRSGFKFKYDIDTGLKCTVNYFK